MAAEGEQGAGCLGAGCSGGWVEGGPWFDSSEFSPSFHHHHLGLGQDRETFLGLFFFFFINLEIRCIKLNVHSLVRHRGQYLTK